MDSHLGHAQLVVPNLMDIQQKSLAVGLPLILVKNRPKTAKSNEMTIAQKPSIYGISAFLLDKGIRLPKPWVASSNLVARSSNQQFCSFSELQNFSIFEKISDLER